MTEYPNELQIIVLELKSMLRHKLITDSEYKTTMMEIIHSYMIHLSKNREYVE